MKKLISDIYVFSIEHQINIARLYVGTDWTTNSWELSFFPSYKEKYRIQKFIDLLSIGTLKSK